MLSENIKAMRKAKGLSQEELAVKLNVVRQTISKWEQGLSVPDADLLLAISEALETPVSSLLGETAAQPAADDLKAGGDQLTARPKKDRQKKDAFLAVRLAVRGCDSWFCGLGRIA